MKDYSQRIDDFIQSMYYSGLHKHINFIEFDLNNIDHETYFVNYFKSIFKDRFQSYEIMTYSDRIRLTIRLDELHTEGLYYYIENKINARKIHLRKSIE